jgi:MIP family channel proteins
MYRRVFGTGLFLFFGIGCLSALKVAGASLGLWEICIIWGLGISLAVYLTSGISGGHLNPAVTVALWLFACFPGRKVLPYIVSQVAGAFGGAVLAYVLYSTMFTEFESAHHIGAAAWKACSWRVFSAPTRRLAEHLACGAGGSGDHLHADGDDYGADRRRQRRTEGPLAPLLIGLLVAVIGASTGPLTGFAMNPARDFGPKLFTWMAGGAISR